MVQNTSAIPSLDSLTSLLGKVLKQYESAVKAKSVNFYPSQLTIASQDIPGPSGCSTSIPWTIRCVPALLDKEKDKVAKKSNKSETSNTVNNGSQQQNKDDVFSPPYQSDLLVEELPEHTVLLNKFCVVPRHFLLVTRDFQPQTLPPSPDSLAIAYRILCAHQRLSLQGSSDVGTGKELLAFYNCGQDSGASQPHQHIQFAELGGEGEIEARHCIPIEVLLERIVKDGKEEDNVHALPLPYQHFVCLLSKADPQEGVALSKYLGSKLLALLDALFQARLSANIASSSNTNTRKSSPSWNLLLTKKAMHLIPRLKEDFDGLKEYSKDSNMVEDGIELIGKLSINSLGFAGHLLVKSNQELEALQKVSDGMTEVLRHTGAEPVADVTAPHQ